MKRTTSAGFTLIELLVTISIIAILASMLMPAAGRLTEKANSTKCVANLRQIGAAANLYGTDNDNRWPAIESSPSDPVYPGGSDGPAPKPIYETLSPYGVTKQTLQCPSDIRKDNFFAKEGSSYQWVNFVDSELTTNTKIYTRRGVRNPKSAWLVLAVDYENVHNGHQNRLYADGHVRDAMTLFK